MVSPVTVCESAKLFRTPQERLKRTTVLLFYLLESHSERDVPCRHGGDFHVLVSKRHQQPAHPLTANAEELAVDLRPFGCHSNTYVQFLFRLWTAVCGFTVPE